ncbi:C40 family peptidase [Streptomyces sp. NPDC001941]|uniref:C40 family peptidase n=1 Tax=Streptomyces sp. NPDC001941 TaxID=3154659 RepID=UPI0033186642
MNVRLVLPSALSLGVVALVCGSAAPSPAPPRTETVRSAAVRPAALDPKDELMAERGAAAAARAAAVSRRPVVRSARAAPRAVVKPAKAAPRPASRPSKPSGTVVRHASAAAVAVDVALAQRGKPYVWGATGPGSFDCSGLTQYAYRRAGIRLPRVTWDQLRAGRRVGLDSIRPGDLVFYRGAAHVGLYVGDGRIVHAPHPGAPVRTADLRVMPVYAVVRPS